MTEKIREYKMNGSLIIGVDAGYGNFKTARRVFPTAVIKSCVRKESVVRSRRIVKHKRNHVFLLMSWKKP